MLLFSSAALHIKARDKWIGWFPRQRVRRVHRGVNNARFLVESFVDESRFQGTFYKACGFEPVGASAGFYLEHGEPKQLFLR
ncbi:MAG: DUF4338 domain-containing protein [Pedosphaera sp.]|nr:DUF4338 domain-containing protein [Pedosphaera sp.]